MALDPGLRLELETHLARPAGEKQGGGGRERRGGAKGSRRRGREALPAGRGPRRNERDQDLHCRLNNPLCPKRNRMTPSSTWEGECRRLSFGEGGKTGQSQAVLGRKGQWAWADLAGWGAGAAWERVCMRAMRCGARGGGRVLHLG